MRILLFLSLFFISELIDAACNQNSVITTPLVSIPINTPNPPTGDTGIFTIVDDIFTMNPLNLNAGLSVHIASVYGQSEYPGCNNPNKYPTGSNGCRTNASIRGNHVYAQRYFFTGIDGPAGTIDMVRATTNDSMHVENAETSDYMSLAISISEKIGEFNTIDPKCTTINQIPSFNVQIRISEDKLGNTKTNTCKLKRNYMYYINTKPYGGSTEDCGLSNDPLLTCNFHVDHNVTTDSNDYLTNPSLVANLPR